MNEKRVHRLLVLATVLFMVAGSVVPAALPVLASRSALISIAKKMCTSVYSGRDLAQSCWKTYSPAALARGVKVDVGGYALYLRCAGAGSPTVVLDSGYGGTSGEWSEVQPGAASFTRVCSYDRAGLGKSDRRKVSPGTSRLIVHELHSLLHNAHISGPYVLVGHSMGGENMRLYTYKHRRDVVGLVLIDSPVDLCVHLGPFCDELKGEDLDVRVSYVQVHAAAHGHLPGSLDHLPLLVLSNGLGFYDGYSAQFNQTFDELVGEAAAASSNSVHVVATKSNHLIPLNQPDLVVEAIREVVRAARSSSHRLPPCGKSLEQLGGRCVT